jgi:hypothetical protein
MTGFDCYPLVYGGHRSVLSPERLMRRCVVLMVRSSPPPIPVLGRTNWAQLQEAAPFLRGGGRPQHAPGTGGVKGRR